MLTRKLTSLQHPIIKHLVKLRTEREYRQQQQHVLVSGMNLIRELASERLFKTLLIQDGVPLQFPVNAESVFLVSYEMLKKVIGVPSPEPVAVEMAMPVLNFPEKTQRLLVLDSLSHPGNVGTLLRTALGLGWEGVFLTQGSTDPYNEKALRASKGAAFKLPWKQGSLQELCATLEASKIPLYAADAGGKDVGTIQPPPALALALGNEAHGLSPAIQERAEILAIPMSGSMESLNVASAGAILMYTLRPR